MKKTTINRTLMAIVIAFGVQTTASAQLGGLLNKAKKAVKDKAESVVSSQKNKAKEQVEKTKAEATSKVTGVATSAAGPELPELMALDHRGHHDDVLWEKIYGFRFATPEEAKDLGSKMTARYLWAKQVAASGATIEDSQLGFKLDSEMGMFNQFYHKVLNLVTLFAPIQMQKDKDNGLWFYTGNATYNAQISRPDIPASQKGIKTSSSETTSMIRFQEKDGKWVFIDADEQARFLEDDELEVAKIEQKFVNNLALLLEDIAKTDDDYMAKYQAATNYVFHIGKAIEGNSVENLEFKPMPKPGALHASLKAQALAIAKKQNKDVLDVVITRDAWDVKRNALGAILHRVAYGYYIVQSKHGKRAVPYSWAQDHQGGGNYGALRHFGVGAGGSFFVK